MFGGCSVATTSKRSRIFDDNGVGAGGGGDSSSSCDSDCMVQRFSRCAGFFLRFIPLEMTVQPLIKSYFILQMGNIKKQIVRQLN